MPSLASQLVADQNARNIAKARLTERYASIKTDLEARGIGGRIADEALERAKLTADEAIKVVDEHPLAVGGTLLAAVLWLIRTPLLNFGEDLIAQIRQHLD